MIRPKFVAVADTVLLDATTNSISLIKIHEQFRPAGYPLLLPRFVIFAVFEREQADPADVEAVFRILLDDQVIHEQVSAINFAEAQLNRAVLQYEGFVIPRPGTMRITATVGDQT